MSTNLSINLPANIEAEIALLAAVVFQPRLLLELGDLRPEDFSDGFMGAAWQAANALFARQQPIDPMALFRELRPGRTKADEPEVWAALIGLLKAVITTWNAPHYAQMIRDAAERRRLIEILADGIATAGDEASTAPEIAAQVLGDLAHFSNRDGLVSAAEIRRIILAGLGKPRRCDATGLRRLDDALAGGLHGGRFYGVGARPKAGKSTLLATVSYNLAIRAEPVPHAYLALESSAEEIMQGMIGRRIGRNRLAFLNEAECGHPDFIRRVADTDQVFEHAGLMFKAKPRMSLDDLKATLARIGLSGKYRGVIVDYLQLVTGKQKGQSQAEHLDDVAQTCAEAAKNYGLWVLAAAQLNRENETRGGDGLLMACDVALSLHRIEANDNVQEAWLEMQASRYTPLNDVGDENVGAYRLATGAGPHFEELAG